MTRKKSLFVSSILIPGLIAIGVAIGMVVPRFSPSDEPAAAGAHVEELTSVEELFDLMGQKAVVLKYSGGDVLFWIELEREGEKQKNGEDLKWGGGPFASALSKPPPEANQLVEGYFIWVRSEPDDEGRERWRFGLQRELVAAKSSAVQVSSPLAHASVSQFREDSQATTR